ncbi:unnamed protein product, partial [Urochloa humidicola]
MKVITTALFKHGSFLMRSIKTMQFLFMGRHALWMDMHFFGWSAPIAFSIFYFVHLL